MMTVNIEFTIEFLGPIHIGSGLEAIGHAQRLVLRDQTGRPAIPGSSLKGAIREAVARFVAVADMLPRDPDGQAGCGRKTCIEKDCLVCRLFGSTRRPGTLRFSDAIFPNEEGDAETVNPYDRSWYDVRNGVSICRQRRTARDQHLYTTEFATPAGAGRNIARAAIRGGIADHNEYELDLPPSIWALLASMSLVNRLGGQRSRGGGQVRLAIDKVTVDNEDLTAKWGKAWSSGAVQDYIDGLEAESEREFAG